MSAPEGTGKGHCGPTSNSNSNSDSNSDSNSNSNSDSNSNSNSNCNSDATTSEMDSNADTPDLEMLCRSGSIPEELPMLSEGDYEFKLKIGSGQFSEVFQVCCRTTGVLRAVKFVRCSNSNIMPLDEIFTSEDPAVREEEVLSYCTKHPHRNIVHCDGLIFRHGLLGFVLEYANGGSLGEVISLSGLVLPEYLVANIAHQCLEGLKHLHGGEKKILHRDIKPDNILVSIFEDDEGVDCKLMLTDFNSARLNASKTQLTGIGTEAFMSPERILGKFHSISSDIWSFGLTIICCALRRNPILDGVGESNRFAVISKILHQPPPTLPEDQFSSTFCDFVSQCLVADPEARAPASSLLCHPFVSSAKRRSRELARFLVDADPQKFKPILQSHLT